MAVINAFARDGVDHAEPLTVDAAYAQSCDAALAESAVGTVGLEIESHLVDLDHVADLGQTDLGEPTLVAQHDPLMSPLVRDLAHVGLRVQRQLSKAVPGPGKAGSHNGGQQPGDRNAGGSDSSRPQARRHAQRRRPAGR